MIVGFSLDRAEAQKHESGQGNVNINHRHRIEDVDAATVNAVDDAVARIRFTFQVRYQQQDTTLADINFDGSVLWQQQNGDIVAAWDEQEELPDDVSKAVANHIYRKCLTQAVGLADSLELPSPVPMPQMG